MSGMGRREFVALLGGAAATLPFAARAQQPAMPAVGILASVSPGPYGRFIEAIKQGLREVGYVEGRNVTIEYRWAGGQYDRLPQLATELVDRGVASGRGRPHDSSRQGSDSDNPDRVQHGGGPSQNWLGGGAQSSRRECHWN
jgi:hypothetical protein